MTVRLYSLHPIPGFVPVTLSGHRGSIVGVHFASTGDVLYTVSKDAATFVWEWTERSTLSVTALTALGDAQEDADSADEAAAAGPVKKTRTTAALASRDRYHTVPDPAASSKENFSILAGEWRLATKHFFKQDHAKVRFYRLSLLSMWLSPVRCCIGSYQVYSSSFHAASGMLVVGFSSGIFGLYTMPECTLIHTLSISQHRIHTCAVNSTGEWLAFGSRSLGQLLVWEWQSESCECPPVVELFAKTKFC